MMSVNKRRSEVIKLIQESRRDAARKNKKIETIDPIIKIGRNLYPMTPRKELLDYCRTALRIILSQANNYTQQTSLLAHI